MKKLVIGLAVNPAVSDSEDAINEVYAPVQTIQGVTTALESAGSRVIQIDADNGFYEKLSRWQEELDLVFNHSQGLPGNESRKSTVAAMLDHLGIPYTGSGVRALSIESHKALSRKALHDRVRNPKWQYFGSPDEQLNGLVYPLFIKPAIGGASIGITQDCVVHSEAQLRKVLHTMIEQTGQPAMVEEFLGGKEYDIGMVGEMVFPALELDMDRMPDNPLVRDQAVKAVDIDYTTAVVSDEVRKSLALQAIQAHRGVGARDYSRSDFRASREDGALPTFLEINLTPGLDPDTSDLSKAASLAGIAYPDVVKSIVYVALRRTSKDPRYRDAVAERETGGFRDAYESAMRSAEHSETIEFGGVTYRLLTPRTEGV